MLRRTHSHALVTLPILAGLLAWGLGFRYREQKFRVLLGLSALGIALHLFLDWLNSFGVVFLWPFLDRRFELGWVFIIDLVIWGLTLAPIAASGVLKTPAGRRRAYRLSLVGVGAYLVLCGIGHARSEALVGRELAREHRPAEALRIFPEPLGPGRFRAAALVGEEWRVYMAAWMTGQAPLKELERTDRAREPVVQVRQTPEGRKIEWFMAAPVWTLRPDGGIEVYDLRFRRMLLPGPVFFRVEFPPGGLPLRVH